MTKLDCEYSNTILKDFICSTMLTESKYIVPCKDIIAIAKDIVKYGQNTDSLIQCNYQYVYEGRQYIILTKLFRQ